MTQCRSSIVQYCKLIKDWKYHSQRTTHLYIRSMRCRMYRCRWGTEIINKAAKSMAPRKRANMVPIQVAIMATTPITVLTMAATTTEIITVITSTDTQTVSMAATDLMEYIESRCTWWIGFYKINVSDRIVLLLFLSKYGRSCGIVLDPR